jgi:hypothetical protein
VSSFEAAGRYFVTALTLACDLHYLRCQPNEVDQAMLRITVPESNKVHTTIKLEGKISGPWVEEFHRTWSSLAPSLGTRKLQLDLRGVAFVDANGRELLREIYKETNAIFLADSPLTRYFADDAMQQSPKCGEEGVQHARSLRFRPQ